MLSQAGYLVSSTAEFGEARRRLLMAPPDLLIADVRLGAYNGVYLVLLARAEQPDMPAIVTHHMADAVIEAEAKRAGALFVVTPLKAPELLEMVGMLLAGRPTRPGPVAARRWPRKRVNISATFLELDARVLDVSYAGLRLEVQMREAFDEQFSYPDEIQLPLAGFLVPIRPVWAKRAGPSGPWWCGVEVVSASDQADQSWRHFVDSLP
jgi:DNA-binding response OmpR family regulator